MKKFFFSHPDVILVAVALVLLVVLVGFFSWSINDVVFEVHRATVSSNVSPQAGFDLQDASKINFRGISTSTAPSASVTTPTTTATSTFSTSSTP